MSSFTGENFVSNQRILEEVQAVAAEVGATPAQIERLSHLTPAAGERHEPANMAVVDR